MVAVAETAGLVLAAGAGSRYGMPKILVPGWLERAVGALRDGGCSAVRVVTGAARPPHLAGAEEIHCAGWERGIGASLRAGLTAVGGGPARVVVHVVDCPDVGPEVVERVLTAAGDRLARAVFDTRPGHPVVLPRTHLAPVLAALTDADGAGPYLRGRAHLAVECGDLATGRDIDTPPVGAARRPHDPRALAQTDVEGDERRA
ncbi:nucleotidyltransferase family protein [Georgenia thermotolerans]|uniref:NTP transferase domain-containing protein n=1 Tax=Georgenia thermotolerans TaxID=527326 RepID=A0A7J5UUY1_9MICO|nr:NTP transferase domain-containing protein [Georgenia thermotolerans]KAE8766082.1 NTP transferase domain-containing protein [Georgenia thermotolerans]